MCKGQNRSWSDFSSRESSETIAKKSNKTRSCNLIRHVVIFIEIYLTQAEWTSVFIFLAEIISKLWSIYFLIWPVKFLLKLIGNTFNYNGPLERWKIEFLWNVKHIGLVKKDYWWITNTNIFRIINVIIIIKLMPHRGRRYSKFQKRIFMRMRNYILRK